MTIHPVVKAIQGNHQPHATQPFGQCEACVLLHYLNLSYEALKDVQRMSSMSQWDPQAVAESVRRGFTG